MNLFHSPVFCLRRDNIIALIQESNIFAESNISNGGDGVQIRPHAIIDREVLRVWISALGQGTGTSLVKCFDDALRHIGHLIFRTFEVLDGVGIGENFALSSVVFLVYHVCEVVV